MKFWIDKEIAETVTEDWKDAFRLDIKSNKGSVMYSSLPKIWYHMGKMKMSANYEDLFIIGLTVFAIDKRVSRRLFEDCWTREIDVCIPVLCYDMLKKTEKLWNQMLAFLTGDVWNVQFRETSIAICNHEYRNHKKIDISKCDCVSLFSGGLDSFCGAIYLLKNGRSPCLVGHNEYPKLKAVQEGFCNDFKECYPKSSPHFIGFTAGARAPKNIAGKLLQNVENTSRGRSILFMCAAVSIAGILGEDIPVYIPENGFIGLNVALTGGRKGSCSTRTTHPYFISCFKQILSQMEIMNPVENFFAFMTKREIVQSVSETEAFKRGYFRTISCSHPCQVRYNKLGNRDYPKNCGFCYPCLIRKSALPDMVNEKYVYELSLSEFLSKYSESEISNDFYAVISSVYRYQLCDEKEIRRLVKSTGKLSLTEITKYERVYCEGMNDIVKLLNGDPKMKGNF